MAVFVAASFARGRENSSIDQIRKDSSKIILELVPSLDGSADLIQTKFHAERLQEEITCVKDARLLHSDAGSRREINGNLTISSTIIFGCSSSLLMGPFHQSIFIAREAFKELIVFAKFLVDTRRGLAVIFPVGLVDVDILVVCAASNVDVHSECSFPEISALCFTEVLIQVLYHNKHKQALKTFKNLTKK